MTTRTKLKLDSGSFDDDMGRFILCSRGIREYFNLPRRCSKFTLCLSNKKPRDDKEYYEISGNGYGATVRVPRKGSLSESPATYSGFDSLLIEELGRGEDGYVWIEL